jgi:hypothetical protein
LAESFSRVTEVIWTFDPLESAPEATAKPIPEEPPMMRVRLFKMKFGWVIVMLGSLKRRKQRHGTYIVDNFDGCIFYHSTYTRIVDNFGRRLYFSI